MYLAPNSQSKDAHWFYKADTDRVVSRRSYERVSGIPPAWLNGRRDVGPVIDEDGKKWDFVNGPQQYDVWHLGATSQAIATGHASKYPLPIGINISVPSTLSNIITNDTTTSVTQMESTTIAEPATTSGGVTLQEVPTSPLRRWYP